MRITLCSVRVAALVACAAIVNAQTNFPEIEPNAVRTEATLVNGMVANDTISGVTTGTTVTTNTTTSATVDVFRVKTGPLPLAIYRHALTLTSATVGHASTLRSLLQTNGVISTTDATFQTGLIQTSLARQNAWYGFGKQEEIYYRVSGSASTTAAYSAVLQTSPVTPLVVPGTITTGSVTITTLNQGHTTDTEIYLYDANLSPVPLGHNDEIFGGPTNSSTVTLNLNPGAYYVAVSNYNTSNNQSDLNPSEGWDDASVLDFPDVMACGSQTTAANVAFAITDSVTTVSVPATKLNAFDIVWATFTVTLGSTPSNPFCDGSVVGSTCVACGNNGAAGRGCANSSFPSGGLLTNSGIASLGADSLVLSAADITGPGLFFQATAVAASPITFGDGMLCASVGIIRLGVVFPSAGSASYPGGLTPNPISVGGAPIAAGNTRHYQCWYRDAVAFCTASTFNLTNGISLIWTP